MSFLSNQVARSKLTSKSISWFHWGMVDGKLKRPFQIQLLVGNTYNFNEINDGEFKLKPGDKVKRWNNQHDTTVGQRKKSDLPLTSDLLEIVWMFTCIMHITLENNRIPSVIMSTRPV